MPEPAAGLSGLSPQQREAVVRRLAEQAREAREPAIPARGEVTGPAPLSLLQEQLWLVDQLDQDQAAAYNMGIALRLTGPLDGQALRRSLTEILARHAMLRIVVKDHGGVPGQVIQPVPDLALPVEDRVPPGGQADEAALLAELARDARSHIDLAAGPVTRFRLLRAAPDVHLLCMIVHHACCDGGSLAVLLDELRVRYAAHVAGRDPDLPGLPVQYADFAVWQRERLAAGEMEAHLRYWEQQLAGCFPVDLPTDRPRPAQPSFRGELFAHRIPAEIADRARELARAEASTLFSVTMAALAVVLARYTGQDDIVVGTANAGRYQPELEPLVGLLVNMNPLRLDLSGDPAFSELVGRVTQATAQAHDHGEVPFARVVERVSPPRDPSRNPLFQVAMDMRPGAGAWESAGVRLDMTELGLGSSRFDIAINAVDEPGGLTLWVEYASDLFDRWRMDALVGHLEAVLVGVAGDPGLRVSQVGLLSAGERELVLSRWQGEVREYRRELVHVLVGEQAAAVPQAEAVVFGDQSLSYAQLWSQAGVLAGVLRGLGVGAGDVVAVAVERGLWVPVALLGVLRAGAAFVPLELSHPPDRLAWILHDCAARAVLTTAGLAAGLPAGGWPVIALDQADLSGPAPELPETATLDSPVYVLYTSGSTGRPKGVVIEHHALATYLDFLGNVFAFGPGDRMLQFSALIFDLSEGELFTGLSRGATVVLVPPDATVDPRELSALMRRQQVSYLGAPPAMIALLDPEPYPALRGMLVGGEAFSGDLVNRWNLPGRLFLNAYGPTEATIGCTYYPCEHRHWATSPPIGRAMPHRRVYLLDQWNNPVPIGVPGEIVAAGEGLARGYVNNRDLTAAKFTPDPFVPGDRAYHTGDLGAWTPDGQIQFLGRRDTQIKLRGQRIELEEIDTALTALPGISQAITALRHDLPGGDGIAAYLLPTPGTTTPTPATLRDQLAATLPAYMIPAAYVTLDTLPLSPTGKVNRAALPAPTPTDTIHAPYTPPTTPTEHLIATIYTTILGHPHIGAHDNFFDLGGNSLQAARVAAHVQEQLGVEMRVRDVFGTPVVAELATLADRLAASGPDDGEVSLLAAEVAELERQLEAARSQLPEPNSGEPVDND